MVMANECIEKNIDRITFRRRKYYDANRTEMGTPYHASPPPGKANELRRNEFHAMSRIQRESTDTSGQIERLLNTKREANGIRGTRRQS